MQHVQQGEQVEGGRMPAEMTLRDNFAAAALTGLLVNANNDIDEDTLDTPSDIAYTAYQMADAMIRERCRAGGNCPGPDNAPNHDAAPAAIASEATASPERVRVRGDAGTGDTQEPVAWGLMRVGGRWVSILNSSVQAETSRQSFDKMENWVHSVVPLYRHQQPTLTDAEREALHYVVGDVADITGPIEDTLRGLLERLK